MIIQTTMCDNVQLLVIKMLSDYKKNKQPIEHTNKPTKNANKCKPIPHIYKYIMLYGIRNMI